MTNEKRDELIQNIHDFNVRWLPVLEELQKSHKVVNQWIPVLQEHHITLFGDGNGKRGLKERVLLNEERIEQHPKTCEGRKAASIETKRYNIAMICMIITMIMALYTIMKEMKIF